MLCTSLGTAVQRDGATTAAPGQRAATLAWVLLWPYAPSAVNEATAPVT
ncbi:MAG: hypothetical protein JOY66_18135 [Acetobacteraceae bacterium]|nr:hypothetical protein [Acetobacteraceae bacterium]